MKYSTLLVSVITFGMAYAGFTCGRISYGDNYCKNRVSEIRGYTFEPNEGDFGGSPPYTRVPLNVQSFSGSPSEGSNHWLVVDKKNKIVGAMIFNVHSYTICQSS
ncbi:hypothetical protein K3495_g15699 [Podosphaera aphanis]|nr:hypothetical protein K3495_g15699 [Podosphaera aphanis]